MLPAPPEPLPEPDEPALPDEPDELEPDEPDEPELPDVPDEPDEPLPDVPLPDVPLLPEQPFCLYCGSDGVSCRQSLPPPPLLLLLLCDEPDEPLEPVEPEEPDVSLAAMVEPDLALEVLSFDEEPEVLLFFDFELPLDDVLPVSLPLPVDEDEPLP